MDTRKSNRRNLVVPPDRLQAGAASSSKETTEEDKLRSPDRKMSTMQSISSDARKKRIDLEAETRRIDAATEINRQITELEAERDVTIYHLNHNKKRQQDILQRPEETRTVEENENLLRLTALIDEQEFDVGLLNMKIDQFKQKLTLTEQAIKEKAAVEKEVVDLDEQYLDPEDEAAVKAWENNQEQQRVNAVPTALKSARKSDSDLMDHHDDDDIDDDSEGSERATVISNATSQSNEAIDKLVAALDKLSGSKRGEQVIVKSAIDRDLPKFDGKCDEWTSFKAQYDRTTKKHKFDDSDNLFRLRKALSGDAYTAVKFLFNTPDNVGEIMETLELEFGRPELIIESLISVAEAAPNPDVNKPSTLIGFARAVQSLVSSIKGHGQTDYMNNIYLLNKLTEKLPSSLFREWIQWYKSDDSRKKNLEHFAKWISIQKEMACEMSKPKSFADEKVGENKPGGSRSRRGPATAAISVSAESDAEKEERKCCTLCKKSNHQLSKCYLFKKKNVADRWNLVKKEGICYGCLNDKHQLKNCKTAKDCGKDGCQRKHHPLLHADDKNPDQSRSCKEAPNPSAPPLEDDGVHYNVRLIEGADGPLGIVPVKIRGPNGARRVYALLDSGATSSFVDGDLAAELGIAGEEREYTVKGIFGNVSKKKVGKVDFEISGSYPTATYSKLSDVKSIEGGLRFSPYTCNMDEIKRKWPHLHKMKMENIKNGVVQVIIGEDHGHLTMHRQLLYKDERSPVGKRTKLGWFIGGKLNGGGDGSLNHIMGTDDYLHQLIKSSFSLDNFGVRVLAENEKGSSLEDRKSLEILEGTYKKENNVCEVGLLWRNSQVELPESREAALDRLVKIERRIKRDPLFGKMYCEKFQEYKEKGYITKASPTSHAHHPQLWYVPHFGVYNPNKPGKLRLVFDAAATTHGTNLNEHLMKGPDLIRPLTEVIWNFRRHPYVISGDIEDMFHRVKVREEDRSAQRFLWRDGDSSREPEEYQMNALIFGAAASPASAIFVKNRNAEEFKDKYPEAYRVIVEDFYVDDALTGTQTEEEAIKLFQDVTWINAQGNFNVKKWTSNSARVLSHIPPELRAQGAKDFGDKSTLIPSERVLGLWWDPTEDCFSFRANFHKVDPEILKGRRPTKREMCGLVMSLYDPIGFINNFKVKGMMILQQSWRDKIGWDDEIGDHTFEDWKMWVNDIPKIEEIKIPRCYDPKVSEAESVELHTLVDASAEGYCAICYLRVKANGNVSLSLVASKVRVAPLKKTTIPRMELMAALLGVRLARSIQDGLRINITARHFWSDSKTVLSWIKTETARLKEFVANRVGEIQELTDATEWHWVPTELNVADDGTRLGKSIDFSSSSRWINGPNFLLLEADAWPIEKKSIIVSVAAGEDEPVEVKRISGSSPDIKRFSSFNRLVRVAGLVVAAAKWWRNTDKKGSSPPWTLSAAIPKWTGKEKVIALKPFLCAHLKSHLTATDLEAGEVQLLKSAQMEAFKMEIKCLQQGRTQDMKKSRIFKLSPVVDSSGIIRLGGRIDAANVPEETKRPVLLPGNHHLTHLLILKEHVLALHQERDTVMNNLRKKYWIIGGRSIVNRVVRQCPVCHILNVKPVIPEMGSLPHYRLASYQPRFTFTGVDFFGPQDVTVARHREKRWVSLFVCMVTRAVHVEVSHGLSTDDMMMVLSRFMDCRGSPHHIYSDNGTNFVGSSRELKEALQKVDFDKIQGMEKFNGVKWHFIPPASPHMGGAWERLVQSVKKALYAVLKERKPRDQTLLTALKAVENVINSRPITFVSSDPQDPEALTPNHFLRGHENPGPTIPAIINDGDEFSRRQWKVAQAVTNHFWDRWTTDFLPELLTRQKWHAEVEPLQVGDIVIVVDDQLPRNLWIKAVISAVFPGPDGQVRVVDVTTRDFKTKKVTKYKRPVSKICPLGLRMDVGDVSSPSGAGM